WAQQPTRSGPCARRLPKLNNWRLVAGNAGGSARNSLTTSGNSCSTTRGTEINTAGSYSTANSTPCLQNRFDRSQAGRRDRRKKDLKPLSCQLRSADGTGAIIP